MTNDQMKPERYLKWHNYRRRLARIQATLAAGGVVQVVGYGKVLEADRRHAAMFKATRTGVYLQRGKAWDCLNFSLIRHTR
jgi:hypothetical protein